jgi:hypothetical protein
MTTSPPRSPAASGLSSSDGSRHQPLIRAAAPADDGSGGAQVVPWEMEGFVVDWQLGPRSGERS